jgi:hypothetical protein
VLGSDQHVGWIWIGDSYSPGVSIHDDAYDMPTVLRIQGIEFNDQIRKSAYSFEMTTIIEYKYGLYQMAHTFTKVYFQYIINSRA